MSQEQKAQLFRDLHEGPGAFVIPNPWDVGTARILAVLGFKALATTSAGLAVTLGRRDAEGAISRSEALAHVGQIVKATSLPVSADLENGFGDAPETVAETISLAAEVGVVGGSIEDATGNPEKPLYDLSLAVERIAAAVEAARALPFPFVVTARAENYLYGRQDLEDTLTRLKAFERAGADVLYAPGLRDINTIKTICSEVRKPVNVVAGLTGPSFSVGVLSEAGVRRISLGSALFRTATGAFLRAAKEISEHGSFTFSEEAASTAELNAFMAGKRE
jgi:2-methylisocitrate lyase-like PEP mutase family enzyme